MAKDEFLEMERANILTALEDGSGVESAEVMVVSVDKEKNTIIVKSDFNQLMTFMYSAPDDMWLRVVPEGGAVACTRLEKIKPFEEPEVIPHAYPDPQVIIDEYSWLTSRKNSLRNFFTRG